VAFVKFANPYVYVNSISVSIVDIWTSPGLGGHTYVVAAGKTIELCSQTFDPTGSTLFPSSYLVQVLGETQYYGLFELLYIVNRVESVSF